MNLADKPCYPTNEISRWMGESYIAKEGGLTFRERLIIALASNPMMKATKLNGCNEYEYSSDLTTKKIIRQADAIIAEMEK